VERKAPIGVALDPGKRLILVTAHRRDSFGEPIRQICQAVHDLCEQFADIEVLWPVHPNPMVRPVVESILGDHPESDSASRWVMVPSSLP